MEGGAMASSKHQDVVDQKPVCLAIQINWNSFSAIVYHHFTYTGEQWCRRDGDCSIHDAPQRDGIYLFISYMSCKTKTCSKNYAITIDVGERSNGRWCNGIVKASRCGGSETCMFGYSN